MALPYFALKATRALKPGDLQNGNELKLRFSFFLQKVLSAKGGFSLKRGRERKSLGREKEGEGERILGFSET